jgi:transcription initiation factor TFIIB
MNLIKKSQLNIAGNLLTKVKPFNNGIVKNKKTDNTELICFGCGSDNLNADPEKGDIVCHNCGLVAEESIFFDNQDARSFAGLSELKDKGYTRNNSASIDQTYLRKLKRAEKWGHSWSDVHIVVFTKELKRLISFSELPDSVFNSSNNLYMKALKKNGIQGRGIYAMSAACIYIVCRMQKIPIFFSELVKASRVSQSAIRKCYNYLMANFEINLPIIQPKQFIPKLISVLGFNNEIENLSVKILRQIQEKNSIEIRITNPKNLAIIAIFFAYNIMKKKNKGIGITQREFSKLVSLSETTLRKYRNIFESTLHRKKTIKKTPRRIMI